MAEKLGESYNGNFHRSCRRSPFSNLIRHRHVDVIHGFDIPIRDTLIQGEDEFGVTKVTLIFLKGKLVTIISLATTGYT